MDTASSPPPSISASPPAAIPTSWPRSAQLSLAFLLGAGTALLLVYTLNSSHWTTQPAVREQGVAVGYRVDLNRADHAELLQLPGVGEPTAKRIEDYRHVHGPFQSVDDLSNVNRMGPAALRRLRPWVTVDNEPDARPARNAAPAKAKRPRGGNKAALLKERVNINRASLTELQRVPWIGPTTAQRIIEERQKRPFRSVDELRRVKGVGVKKLEYMRPYVTVGDDSLQVAVTAERP
jgi:competence protein ComEA